MPLCQDLAEEDPGTVSPANFGADLADDVALEQPDDLFAALDPVVVRRAAYWRVRCTQ